MITLERQYIDSVGDKARLYFDFTIDGQPSCIWYEVDNDYAKYLCTERCDAFVIGLLPYALKNNHNIETNIPITEELSYKLNENLIPLLSKYDKHLSNIKIVAPMTSEIIQNAGAVGTGVSAGADSFHAILSSHKSAYESMRLTHLCLFNVGSFEGNNRFQKDIYNKCVMRSKLIAEELGLPLVISNSNLADVFPRTHSYTHDYSSVFGVLCLQKLWKIYYYASSCTNINVFTLINSSKNDLDVYAPLLHYCFNNKNTVIVSEGMQKNKLEKFEAIADEPIVQKYLHVCTDKAENCGKCSKCQRTILTLDAIGKLEKFANVFDIDYYRKNKLKYYWLLFKQRQHKVVTTEAVYNRIKPKIPFMQFLILKILVAIRYFVFDVTYPERKLYINIKILGINFKFKKK